MDWTDLLTYIQQGENIQTKFIGNAGTDDDLGPTLVAIANTEGGKIFVGLDIKNCHLRGTHLSEKWVEKLSYKCYPTFSVAIKTIVKGEKSVLCISIPEGTTKPYYYKKKAYFVDPTNEFKIMEKEGPVPTDIPEPLDYDVVNEAKKELSDTNPDNIAPSETTTPPPQQSFTSPWKQNYTEEDAVEPQKQTEVQDTTPIPFEPAVDPVWKQNVEKIESELIKAQTTHTHDVSTNFLEPQQTSAAMPGDELNHRQIKALKYVKTTPFIKNKKYRQLFHVSHKTAHLELVDMVSKGYLFPKGQGRSSCYVFNPSKESII